MRSKRRETSLTRIAIASKIITAARSSREGTSNAMTCAAMQRGLSDLSKPLFPLRTLRSKASHEASRTHRGTLGVPDRSGNVATAGTKTSSAERKLAELCDRVAPTFMFYLISSDSSVVDAEDDSNSLRHARTVIPWRHLS